MSTLYILILLLYLYYIHGIAYNTPITGHTPYKIAHTVYARGSLIEPSGDVGTVGAPTATLIFKIHNSMIINKSESEIQLQSRCFQWAHNTYPSLRGLLFSVPNGGYRNKIEAGQLKSSGVIAGIPDLLCLFGGVTGIEMKIPGGHVSDAQAKIHERWRAAGIRVEVCYSFEEFQSIIKSIIC
jgi:hypothetical protein